MKLTVESTFIVFVKGKQTLLSNEPCVCLIAQSVHWKQWFLGKSGCVRTDTATAADWQTKTFWSGRVRIDCAVLSEGRTLNESWKFALTDDGFSVHPPGPFVRWDVAVRFRFLPSPEEGWVNDGRDDEDESDGDDDHGDDRRRRSQFHHHVQQQGCKQFFVQFKWRQLEREHNNRISWLKSIGTFLNIAVFSPSRNAGMEMKKPVTAMNRVPAQLFRKL